ncbi:hypothetical protein [Pseudomonas sp. BJa3]|uniref:hypothetical protein n=1 Tax=Pseudomonas sp. BJa3 TaxID=2986525 RepID=UPI002265D7A9|nr:hypothetical protein [Pseudomonas sp. BJa3]MCX5510494.1 hypothetical protein [Pseudomonas sp. BJa3]
MRWKLGAEKGTDVFDLKVFYEHEIKRALNDPTKTVGPTTVSFIRSNPNVLRPDALEVTYTINGRKTTRMFDNEPNTPPVKK